jgi:hypothetical protein
MILENQIKNRHNALKISMFSSAFFYIIINGITWCIASKLIKNLPKYEKTLNKYLIK